MVTYRATLACRTTRFLAGEPHRHPKEQTRRLLAEAALLRPGRHGPGYLAKSDTFAQLGTHFGVSTDTAWRYVNEGIDVLAAHAPSLADAVRTAKDSAACCWTAPWPAPGVAPAWPPTPTATRSPCDHPC